MSQALAEAGAGDVALLDVKQKLGCKAAAELHKTTRIPVQFYKVDATDEKAVVDVVANIGEDSGSNDVVVNPVGVVDSNIKAETYDAFMFRRLLDIDLTAPFLVSQACAQHMIAPKAGGSIIFLSSISHAASITTMRLRCFQGCGDSAGQVTGCRMGPTWHQSQYVAPGYMDTALNRDASLEGQNKHWSAMTPMGGLGQPHGFNGLAVSLAGDASGIVTGAHILADGGYSVY